MTESQALLENTLRIEAFRQKHGIRATEDAISNGAFHIHPEFGELKDIYINRDFSNDDITIPQWISDIFIEKC